jgi:hypothetical protein
VKKKALYIAGAIGVVPALGLAMPAATGQAVVKSAPKTSTKMIANHKIDLRTCTAHRKWSYTSSGVRETFYSAPVGTRICIGTIGVNADGVIHSVSQVGAAVGTVNGYFCKHFHTGRTETYGCHETFTKNRLKVVASAQAPHIFPTASVSDPYPFHNN